MTPLPSGRYDSQLSCYSRLTLVLYAILMELDHTWIIAALPQVKGPATTTVIDHGRGPPHSPDHTAARCTTYDNRIMMISKQWSFSDCECIFSLKGVDAMCIYHFSTWLWHVLVTPTNAHIVQQEAGCVYQMIGTRRSTSQHLGAGNVVAALEALLRHHRW